MLIMNENCMLNIIFCSGYTELKRKFEIAESEL